MFAIIHGKLRNNFNEPKLRRSLAVVGCVASLAAKPEAARGLRMAPASKAYARHSAEADGSAWNDGSTLLGGVREGRHQAQHARRGTRKAGSAVAGSGQRQRFHAHMA